MWIYNSSRNNHCSTSCSNIIIIITIVTTVSNIQPPFAYFADLDGSALQNAASVAGLMITTEVMIADAPSDNKGPAMPDMGGMGGMGGMM